MILLEAPLHIAQSKVKIEVILTIISYSSLFSYYQMGKKVFDYDSYNK